MAKFIPLAVGAIIAAVSAVPGLSESIAGLVAANPTLSAFLAGLATMIAALTRPPVGPSSK